MNHITLVAALLCGTTVALSSPAAAQAAPPSGDAAIQQLQKQVDELQRAIAELKAQSGKAAASWKGAPQLEDKNSGWSFKPRGRLQYDFATVSSPGGIDNPGLGFSNEVRRARLGVEGKMPGDIGYKFEVDVATGDVEFADAYLSYSPGDVEFIVGQHNNFQSLEELTSSLHTSFIERAAFTDAFGFERRVGASAQYENGPILLQGGLFTDSIADLNSIGDDNDSYGFDGRAVFAPKLGKNQLHFAGSVHWRDLNDTPVPRYRQRPAVHTTDVRFIDTGNISGAEKEVGYGVEAAGIFGPFHAAGEAYWQNVSRTGFADPTFFGAYADIGFFITGETRGYKGGKFDRVKVLKPFGKGGFGSLGVNLRWDYLDLSDAGIFGGRQNAYQASVNWKPTDYVLFGLNYAHLVYDDAAFAADDGDRNYTVDMIGFRSQVDF
ncbi:MAG TPA: porin [Sphingomicrobium sp.]|nr:porin [Sphingomicrobium sp.]